MWSEEQLFYENNSQGGEVTREREKKNKNSRGFE